MLGNTFGLVDNYKSTLSKFLQKIVGSAAALAKLIWAEIVLILQSFMPTLGAGFLEMLNF